MGLPRSDNLLIDQCWAVLTQLQDPKKRPESATEISTVKWMREHTHLKQGLRAMVVSVFPPRG